MKNGEVVTDDKSNAVKFSGFFIYAASSLSTEGNLALLDDVDEIIDPVKRAIKKFGHHPSIIDIRKNVSVTTKFSFSEVDVSEMILEMNNLNAKKSGTFMNIPVKRLMDAVDIVAQPLTDIWKFEVVLGHKFSSQLKLADITPLNKKLRDNIEGELQVSQPTISTFQVIREIVAKTNGCIYREVPFTLPLWIINWCLLLVLKY